MSKALLESVDIWRLVSARRMMDGRLGLDTMPRLALSLASPEGECQVNAEFGHDDLGIAFADLKIETVLPLTCQRTLERFEFPVSLHQRLGLIRAEHEEAALPENYEPFLVPSDGQVRIADMVEDELILAVPVVPMSEAGLLHDDLVWVDSEEPVEIPEPEQNPFAALAALKKTP